MEQITGHQEEAEQNEAMAEEWRALGNVIDRLIFVISLVILLSLFIWMVTESLKSQIPVSHGEEDESDSDH